MDKIFTLADARAERVRNEARQIMRERKANLRVAVKALRRAQQAAKQYGGEMHAELVTTRLLRVIELQKLCGYPVDEAAGELPIECQHDTASNGGICRKCGHDVAGEALGI